MKQFIQDCKHMLWLFKQMIMSGLKGDWGDSLDAWCWIKIHWNHESRRLK